jgi:MurNAc alpha-1-phosphate uridylyltransferase
MTQNLKPVTPVKSAMVLAAGLGTRMRPLTDRHPKPLIPLAGRALIDHVLDRIALAGIGHAVVNLHYCAAQLERHLQGRTCPRILLSHESSRLLDTGGGVKQALPLLGPNPFLVHNSDSVWSEGETANLTQLMQYWDGARMDALLLLAVREASIGYEGEGDFSYSRDGRLARRQPGQTAPYVFTGVSILKPDLFQDVEDEVFSLNLIFDRAMARDRLFGFVLDGVWMHVGTEHALNDAETRLHDLESRRPYASGFQSDNG